MYVLGAFNVVAAAMIFGVPCSSLLAEAALNMPACARRLLLSPQSLLWGHKHLLCSAENCVGTVQATLFIDGTGCQARLCLQPLCVVASHPSLRCSGGKGRWLQACLSRLSTEVSAGLGRRVRGHVRMSDTLTACVQRSVHRTSWTSPWTTTRRTTPMWGTAATNRCAQTRWQTAERRSAQCPSPSQRSEGQHSIRAWAQAPPCGWRLQAATPRVCGGLGTCRALP